MDYDFDEVNVELMDMLKTDLRNLIDSLGDGSWQKRQALACLGLAVMIEFEAE